MAAAGSGRTHDNALRAVPVLGQRAMSRRLVAALFALAAASWVVTDARMGGMGAMPWMDPGSLGFFVVAWVVMMAAMMLPSATPMVAMYDRLRAMHRERGDGAPPDANALFLAGYLLIWALAGLAAYAVFALVRGDGGDALVAGRGGQVLAGAVILAAAVYQVTPLKDACLTRCRGPLMFLMQRWRDGRAGAVRLGALHGAWCLGCCWALMATLFALGVMSVGWMVFVAGLIALEKLWPWRTAASRAVAVVLAVLGLGLLVAPDLVPGLAG